jgi:hypothetical protein
VRQAAEGPVIDAIVLEAKAGESDPKGVLDAILARRDKKETEIDSSLLAKIDENELNECEQHLQRGCFRLAFEVTIAPPLLVVSSWLRALQAGRWRGLVKAATASRRRWSGSACSAVARAAKGATLSAGALLGVALAWGWLLVLLLALAPWWSGR